MSAPVVPKGGLVLVTGAAGYIGAAVVQHLLAQGYRVRGATRSKAKIQPLTDKFDQQFGEGRFEVVEVADFAVPGAYDAALKDVDGVAHIAGDTSFGTDFDKAVHAMVSSHLDFLDAAQRSGTVKRFVVTSSRAAAYNPKEDDDFDVGYWQYNEEMVKAAHELPDDNPLKGRAVYATGKVETEKAVYNYIKEKKPSFGINVILPDYTMGEVLNPNSSSTGSWLNEVLLGREAPFALGVTKVSSYYVDNTDLARLYLAALTEPDVVGERLWGAAHPFTINDVLAIWRKHLPERRETIPADFPGSYAKSTKVRVDNSRSLELLRRQGQEDWVSLEQTVLKLAEAVA